MADTQNDSVFQIKEPRRQVLFDLPAFDRAIAAHGVKVIHYRALRCPGGLTSKDDWRRPHEDHNSCQGGFLFKEAGQCFMLFTSNSSTRNSGDIGLIAQSSGYVTFSSVYDNGKSVSIAKYDRLLLPESPVSVETWELFNHSSNGIDILTFPVKEVIYLISSSGKEYTLGDFQIVDDKLKWSNNQPSLQPNGEGEVCGIRYSYKPYWIISQLPHELRFATKIGGGETGNLGLVSVHQSAYVQRENVFHSQDNDPETKPNSRKVLEPTDAQFLSKDELI